MNADEFLKRLKALRSPAAAKSHSHLASNEDDAMVGVGMGQVFALAKEFINMDLDEVEKMLESPIHKMRVGAVSIMDFQARSKKTTEARRKELFNLYIRRHDRINTWDLVDRSAILWLAVTCSRNRARFCINWQSPKRCQSAAPPL